MKKLICLVIAFVIIVDADAQKIKLCFNLTKGETYSHNMVSTSTISQEINGQSLTIDMNMSCNINYTVSDIIDSVYVLSVQYESMSIKMKMPKGTMEFNSENKDVNDAFSTVLGAMKHQKFNLKMTKTGKINEVSKLDSLFVNVLDKLPEMTAARKQQLQAQFMKAFGEKAFKGNFEMVTLIYTDKQIEKGSKWITSTQLESGVFAKMITTYELADITDSYAEIKGNSTIGTTDKDAFMETNGMQMRYDMKGNMITDIKVDLKTGWVIASKTNQNIDGINEIKDSPKMPGGMKIPMTVVSEITVSNK